VGVVAAFTANLPEAVVWLAPSLAHELAKLAQHALLSVIERPALFDESEGAMDHGTVNVELELLDSRVADAHRLGSAIPFEVIKLFLADPRPAEDVIDDPQLWSCQTRRVEEPL
jgi:hypothetical protein